MRIAQLLVPCCLLVSACSEYAQRHGLDPELNGAQVRLASQNKQELLEALAFDAGVGPTDYYAISVAGFNYVDDRCQDYFGALFRLDRRRQELKNALSAFDKTSAAVLTSTGATAVTINVVAQAFGLGGALTDVVAGTYLYQLPPATTQGFVIQTQELYRKNFAEQADRRMTKADAYHAIQQYLSLCLPPTIEANIVKYIASTKVTPADGAKAPAGSRLATEAFELSAKVPLPTISPARFQ